MNQPDFWKRILRSDPGVEDQDAKKMVVGVLSASLLVDILLAISNINTWPMLIFGALLLLSLLLALNGKLTPGRHLVPFAGLIMFGFLMFQHYGLRDTAILGLPMILISASLMVGRWGAVFYGMLCLALVGCLAWAEASGYIRTDLSASIHWTDYLATSICIVMITILQWLVIGRLNENITKARSNEEAQKIANEALRASEARQHALLDAIPELVFRLSQDGVFVDYHAPQNSWLFMPPDFFLGKPIRAVMPPDIAAKTIQAIHQVLQTGQAAQFEYALPLDKDQVRYFDARMVVSGPGEVLTSVRDITERKQAEEQIHQGLHELATIHAVSQAAAAQLELDALFELIAQELFHLFDIQEIFIALHNQQTGLVQFPYYQHGDQRLTTEPVPMGQGLSSQVIQSRRPLLINQDYEQRSSELGVVRFSPVPVNISQVSWLGVPIQAGEEVIGVICVQNLERENVFTEADVRLLTTIASNVGIAIQNAQLYSATQQELTERRQIQQEREKLIAELENKNAELERFTYTVSHDLKSPLVTIRGFLGFVEKNALSGNVERVRADMARIIEATEKMQRLLNELLELSRIGRTMNPPQVVPFEAIVREAVGLVCGRIEALHMQMDIAPNLPSVYCDQTRLVEVMQNLIDNAAKFMGAQPMPCIEIGARSTGAEDRPTLFVRDNGMGIDPLYHERIFGLFNKLDSRTDGTGVGLALVRRIIEVHGGRIWVESEGIGHGATFCFTLPAPPADALPPRKE
jgi:signal transduction histidine kinase/PAS domain-containing protein